MNHLQNLSFSLHCADPSLCLVWVLVGLDFCPFQVEYSPSPFGKNSSSCFLVIFFFFCSLTPFCLAFIGTFLLLFDCWHFTHNVYCTWIIMHLAVYLVSLSKTSINGLLSEPNRLGMMQQCSAGRFPYTSTVLRCSRDRHFRKLKALMNGLPPMSDSQGLYLNG